MLSLGLPLAAFVLLLPIVDRGVPGGFGTPFAYALGAVFAAAIVIGLVSGIRVLRRSVSWGWRLAALVGILFGLLVAVGSLVLLWFFRPD